jgi:UDP-N-acetylmuramyl pentapeptide phosphotransferase/UDP-N-acetylglucosamine-1-phosphate transferase
MNSSNMKNRTTIGGVLLVAASLLLGCWMYSLGREWFLIYVLFGGVIIMALAALLDEARKTSRGSAKAPAIQGKSKR